MKLIVTNLNKIKELCKNHNVKKLSIFGSILTNRFTQNSDIDFLVDFERSDHQEFDYVSNYFELRDKLEFLLGHRIDLIEERGLRNKYFIENINRTKQLIYG